MKRFIISLAVICLCGLILAQPTWAQADTATNDTLAQRCVRTQSYLQSSLRSLDLRARVNRLQAYQYLHQRLDMFTKRLEHNKQAGAAELRAQLTTFSASTNSFKNNYEAYNTARDKLADLNDCQNNVGEFQNRLQLARDRRRQVNNDIAGLQTQLAAMKTQLEGLYQHLLATDSTGGAQ